MIDHYDPISPCTESGASRPSITPSALTIERNSVVVLRCSKNDYDLDDMNVLRDYYRKVFPNNTVCVMFDDIEIEIVHDKSWKKARPCAEEPYDPYNSI